MKLRVEDAKRKKFISTGGSFMAYHYLMDLALILLSTKLLGLLTQRFQMPQVVGALLALVAAIAGNLVITPAWLGVPLDAVIAMIVPILIPFNLLKTILNSVLTLVVYKAVSNLITPKKKQVKGRVSE